MTDFLNALNPRQREAVELPNVSALILAGAGSGKTRVLTTRIAWLLSQGKASPWEILAVTFTNKAAREMRTRLETMLKVDVSQMWVGTFHGICHKLLRRHATEAGLPKTFQIIDQADQLALVKRLMKEAGINVEKNDPKAFQLEINRAKERGLRAADLAVSRTAELLGLYAAYEGRCRREGLVDFAELLLASVELLETHTDLREHYAKRFRHLLVDEFQDTNALQYRWIKAIASPGSAENCVFCVGDDDQSIYAFRGARVGNMADFVREYGISHTVKLEQNYRSTSHILDAANALIAQNADRLGKNLWTEAGAGERIGLYEALSDREEAGSIAQEILSRHRTGARYSDFAVLYRNNAQSRILEEFFLANTIPYRVYGGLRFFDRQEVKDVIAYLRVLVAPDDTSVLRVINHPPRGIGAGTVEKLTQKAQEANETLWTTLLKVSEKGSDAGLARTRGFVQLIASINESCAGMGLNTLIRTVIDLSGLKAYYEKQLDHDIRLENLSELVSAATSYCEENDIAEGDDARKEGLEGGLSPLSGFLAQATLSTEERGQTEGSDCVQLMTVHASKGLEFDTVFLCGLEQGLFPHEARLGEDPDRAMSEERRLMYVAMTRAKKHLRLSWCAARHLYGSYRPASPSVFIKEIPEEHLRLLMSGRLGQRHGINRWPQQSVVLDFGFASSSRYDRAPSRNQSRGATDEYDQTREEAFVRPKRQGELNPWGLAVGDQVNHARFGRGTVLSLADAQSEEATAWVKFAVGKKELLLRFAKLEKIS